MHTICVVFEYATLITGLFSGIINVHVMQACKRRGPQAVRTLMKSLLLQSPGTCATMLYLSSYSLRCIFATDTPQIWEKCSNPILPTVNVSLFVMVTFVVGMFAPFLSTKDTTLTDVIELKLSRLAILQVR